MMISQAIVVAGGLGKRMGTLTRQRPKCLLNISSYPILRYTVDGLLAIGLERLIVSVSDEWGHVIKNALKQYYPQLNVEFSYSARKGMAYSVYCARHVVNRYEPVLISVSDVVCFDGYQCLDQALHTADVALGVSHFPLIKGKTYTMATIDRKHRLQRNPPHTERHQSYPLIGVYALQPVALFFEHLTASIESVTVKGLSKDEALRRGIVNTKNEFRLSGVLESLNHAHQKTTLVNMGDCCEINTPDDFTEANARTSRSRILSQTHSSKERR